MTDFVTRRFGSARPTRGTDSEIISQNERFDNLLRQLDQEFSPSTTPMNNGDLLSDSEVKLDPLSPQAMELFATWEARQQGLYRSTCVAFSVLAMIEVAERFDTNADIFPDYSEEYLYHSMRTKHAGAASTPGWEEGATYMEHAHIAMKNEGICREAIMRYDDTPEEPAYVKVPSAPAIDEAQAWLQSPKKTDWLRLMTGDLEKWKTRDLVYIIRQKLQRGQPVAAAFPIYALDNQWNNEYSIGWESGAVADPILFTSIADVYANDEEHEVSGGHAVCLVGYNPDSDHFLFRNSWGEEFSQDFRSAEMDLPRAGYGSVSASHVQNHCWELMYLM